MIARTAGREAALLAACFGRDDGEIARVLEPLADADWNALVDQAVRHGVAPLLWERLKAISVAATPSALERLHESYLHNALRNTAALDELSPVLASLKREEIPVIVLKGAHLASTVYGNPALRPMADIDLLVPPINLPRIKTMLFELGYCWIASSSPGTDYETHHHLQVFFKTGAIPIEIHRSIVPTDSPFRVDVGGMWARARETHIAGIDVRVFAPEDLVLYLCLHASYNHRFDIPLLFLCDIAAAVEHHRNEIDWSRFVEVANHEGTSRFIYCSLRFVQSLLGIDFPRRALNGLRHEESDEAVVEAACDCVLSAGMQVPAVYQELGKHQGFGSKARLLLRGIWPSRERLLAIYDLPLHSRAVYWYYLLRPMDLLHRRGKLTVEMLLRTKRLQPTLDRIEKRRVIDRWIDEVSHLEPARRSALSGSR